MGKYFLGSVGTAEAFRIEADGTRRLMFRSTTLTDQGINVTSTQDEIRAGQGAPIVFTFNHDASVQLTLTDVLWRAEYIEAKLGGTFTGNAADYQDETVTVGNDGKMTLSKVPVDAEIPCTDSAEVIFYSKKGSDDWHMYNGEVEANVLDGPFDAGDYCVRYLANDEQARELWVTSDILPMELYLIIKTPLYAGDSCNVSNGKPAGHITFEVPRFRLDPNLDLALAMSSNISISLNGSALAYTSDCNNNGSRLMRIVECITGRKWNDGLEAIYIDPSADYDAGDVVAVYGVYDNGSTAKLANDAEIGGTQALSFAFDTGVVTVTCSALKDSDTITLKTGYTATAICNVVNDPDHKKGELY